MNPYKILGLEKGASGSEIKKAYRALSKVHHPDAGGNEKEFQKLNLAYRVLSDPEKRRMYDENGTIMDEAEDHIQNMVNTKIAQIAEDWLDNMIKGPKTPLEEFVIDKLDQGISKIKSINIDIKKAINDAENVLNRLSHEQEHTIIHNVIKERISSYKKGIEQNKKEIEVVEQVKEEILKYEYEEEERTRQNTNSIFFGGISVEYI